MPSLDCPSTLQIIRSQFIEVEQFSWHCFRQLLGLADDEQKLRLYEDILQVSCAVRLTNYMKRATDKKERDRGRGTKRMKRRNNITCRW